MLHPLGIFPASRSALYVYATDKVPIKLEGHSVERIYLRQRSFDGSANKTILKRRLALAARRQYVYVGFSRRKIRRNIGNAAKFRSLYDIGESNAVPASGL